MKKFNEILEINKHDYERMYSKNINFLQYPPVWLIGFYNSYLKKYLPKGKVLDYGYGSGANSVYLMERGYNVYGVEVAGSSLVQLKQNMEDRNINNKIDGKFFIIPPDNINLPFADNTFDFILSNQVFYFLPSEEHIKKVCRELRRILKPGGIVMFTMMGAKNYFIAENSQRINGKIYEVEFSREHRLHGSKQIIYVVNTKTELKDLFSDFECFKIGYFDIDVMDGSNFHWIFMGKKS